MSFNRSYESIFLKKERNRLIRNVSIVDTTVATSVPEFRRAVGEEDESTRIDNITSELRAHRQQEGNVSRMVEAPSDINESVSVRSAAPRSVSKSVSFEEPIVDESAKRHFLARIQAPSIVKRPASALRQRASSVSPQGIRHASSPASDAAATNRGRSASPSATFLSMARLLTNIDWQQAFESKTRKQGHDPRRRKALTDILKTIPISGKGSKLTAVGAYITTMDSLPGSVAEKITVLYLSNNSLSDLSGVGQFVNLQTASFANNMIRYLRDLSALRFLQRIDKLSLDGNIVVSMPYYRQFVISLCPSLQYLDGVRIEPSERQSAEILSRKAATLLEQLRTNELRSAVMSHVSRLCVCHTELITTVRGAFSVSRGAHIGGALGSEHPGSGVSTRLCTMLRVFDGGGVFRWLQIGCDDSFGRTVQDISYRIYLAALRNMPLEARSKIHHDIDSMTELWNNLLAEYLHKQQDICVKLVDTVERALQARSKDEPIISGGRDLLSTSDAEDSRLLRAASSDSLVTLQRLQLIDMSSEHAEYRLTYCGLGPHLQCRPRRTLADSGDMNNRLVEVSGPTITPRRTTSTTPSTAARSGGKCSGSKYLEPSSAKKKEPSRSPSPARSSSLSPKRSAKISSDPRDRHSYSDVNWREEDLPSRYDDILEHHLNIGKSTNVSRSNVYTPYPQTAGSLRQQYDGAAVDLSARETTPQRRSLENLSGSKDDATWSAYSNGAKVPATTPFSPDILPPQQLDPDMEGTGRTSTVPNVDNEELLSKLLWDSERGEDVTESKSDTLPTGHAECQQFDPYHSDITLFLASLKSTAGEASSLDGSASAVKTQKPISQRHRDALSLIQECEKLWESESLDHMMKNALREKPMGPHPNAARGSWVRPVTLQQSTPVSTPRRVSPKHIGMPLESPAATTPTDSMRSLKAQFEITSRAFGKIYEDIMTTYDAQQVLRQLSESLREILLHRGKQSSRFLFDLRALLDAEAADLVPARSWVGRANENSERLMSVLSENEGRRIQIDDLYRETEDLNRRTAVATKARDSFNDSIDEVLAAAEGLHREMVESPDMISAVRHSHVFSLAIQFFSTRSYFGLIRLYFDVFRRRVRRQHRINSFYAKRKTIRDIELMVLTLTSWKIFVKKRQELVKRAQWVKRGVLSRYLATWQSSFGLEQKVGVGLAYNAHIRKKHAFWFLHQHAAACRRMQRKIAKNNFLCHQFALRGYFRGWLRYVNRFVLGPSEEQRLMATARNHRLRVMLAEWRAVATLEKENAWKLKVVPCCFGNELGRVRAAFSSWRSIVIAIQHLRRRQHVRGFSCLLRKIISKTVKRSARIVLNDFLVVSKLRPSFDFLRSWAKRRRHYGDRYRGISNRKAATLVASAFSFWHQSYCSSRLRKQDDLLKQTAKLVVDLEQQNVAISHYFDTLLKRQFRLWQRFSKQSKSFRLIAQAEEELRNATETYDKLTKSKQLSIDFDSKSSDPGPAMSDTTTARLTSAKKTNNGKWVVSLDLVSSDEETVQEVGRSGIWDTFEEFSVIPSNTRQEFGRSGAWTSIDTVTPRGPPVVVREYVHASHFEIGLKRALFRWKRFARRSRKLQCNEDAVAVKNKRLAQHRIFRLMLMLWSKSAMRKIAVVKLYADSKQSSTMQNFEFKCRLQSEKSTLNQLKDSLEVLRATLAERQLVEQEVSATMATNQAKLNDKICEFHRMQGEQSRLESQSRDIVNAYESLVAQPMDTPNLSIGPDEVFFTPEGTSQYGRPISQNTSSSMDHLSNINYDKLVEIQNEKDVLDEEIHELHLTYLSLQSTGDANEKILKESKYTAQHLAEQCGEMVSALEAQLKELDDERRVASSVLLNCSRELQKNQTVITHKLSNIEAEMENLAVEEAGLDNRISWGELEEKRLRDELERLWAQEREMDSLENRNMASEYAVGEMSSIVHHSRAVSAIKPAESRLEDLEQRSGNDFLAAIQTLGSCIERNIESPSMDTTDLSTAEGTGGVVLNAKIRTSINKANEMINRQRVNELVEQQTRKEVMKSVKAKDSMNGDPAGPQRPTEGIAVNESTIESEIATIARRIRERLVQPSSAF